MPDCAVMSGTQKWEEGQEDPSYILVIQKNIRSISQGLMLALTFVIAPFNTKKDHNDDDGGNPRI